MLSVKGVELFALVMALGSRQKQLKEMDWSSQVGEEMMAVASLVEKAYPLLSQLFVEHRRQKMRETVN